MGLLFDDGYRNALLALADPKSQGALGQSLLGGLPFPHPLLPPVGTSLATNLWPTNALQTLTSGLGALSPQAIKRKAYFAFKFDDVMRVNNVRNAWRSDRPDTLLFPSFCDSSIWERSRSEGDETLKKLMREGVQGTSAVCVLIGSETWQSRWVKYEIVRAVIDERGLLSVHLNNLNHHERHVPDLLGPNPLDFIGICRNQDGNCYIYEKQLIGSLSGSSDWKWLPYPDHRKPVAFPKFLPEPRTGYVQPLSVGALCYDYVGQSGYQNIGSWIDAAAQAVGR
jgi:hypothetical protein